MQSIIDAILGFFSFIIERPYQLWLDLLDWIKYFVTVILPDVFYSMLPDGVAEYLRTFDLSGINDIVQPIAWFFPFWTLVGIYLVAYSMCGGIRLVRWIIGFIPTIEG